MARQFREGRCAARVDAEGNALIAGRAEKLEQRWQQLRGKIVDAVETAVFEHVERNALARAGQPGDEYQPHCRLPVNGRQYSARARYRA
ncbi:hypothetical protein D3C83_07460 [compost metagenome]